MQTLKIGFGDDFRRISFNQEFKFQDFQKVLSNFWGERDFVVQYKDEEGDIITISTDIELEEAKRFSKNVPLRFIVSVKTTKCPVKEEKIEPLKVIAQWHADVKDKVKNLFPFEFSSGNESEKYWEYMEAAKTKFLSLCDEIQNQAKQLAYEIRDKSNLPEEEYYHILTSVASEEIRLLQSQFNQALARMKETLTKSPVPETNADETTSPVTEPKIPEPKAPETIPEPQVPETIPEPSPEAPAPETPVDSETESKLKSLEEMGFDDREKNKSLLVVHSGDLAKIIESLLE